MNKPALNKFKGKFTATKNHRYQAMIFGAAIIALLLISSYYLKGPWWMNITNSFSRQGPEVTSEQKTEAQKLALPASIPTKIKIDKIGVNAGMVEVGLTSTNALKTPDNGADVGWYKFSPTPGEIGPSVLVGHLDTVKGSAVFYRLHELEIGDSIEIQRKDGKTAVFKVIGKEKYPQTNFETQKVYGDIDYAGLRLITCEGTYLHALGHYSDNLVIYASLYEVK